MWDPKKSESLKEEIMKDRIYVCHTYYHTYISFLKELKIQAEEKDPGEATLVLSKMSNNFEKLGERILSTGVFKDVIEFDEKMDTEFPELKKYKKNGGFIGNLVRRIIFTRKYAKCEAKYVPVDFKEYKNIYVYCDSDPIGTYLNMNRIYYHAVEDGLNCIANCDMARVTNKGHFELKAALSKKFNLIFVENGYGKYCLDMEVNDISRIKYPCPYFKEVNRDETYVKRLTETDKEKLLKAYVRDIDELNRQIAETGDGAKILLLTDPLCTLDVRKQIFTDLVERYSKEGRVFIKPHPRDAIDYKKEFPDVPSFDGTVPMEMLNFFPNLHFKKVVSVFTEMKAIEYADEFEKLGSDFMDKYEAPEAHRFNEI